MLPFGSTGKGKPKAMLIGDAFWVDEFGDSCPLVVVPTLNVAKTVCLFRHFVWDPDLRRFEYLGYTQVG